jgi:hypothetical protein
MTFQVLWMLKATVQFGQIVAASNDKKRVNTASQWMDYTLRRIPKDVGESRNPGYRIWFDDVLVVYYHVDDEKMVVRVLSVALSRRK